MFLLEQIYFSSMLVFINTLHVSEESSLEIKLRILEKTNFFRETSSLRRVELPPPLSSPHPGIKYAYFYASPFFLYAAYHYYNASLVLASRNERIEIVLIVGGNRVGY